MEEKGCNDKVMIGELCTFQGERFSHSCSCMLSYKQCSIYTPPTIEKGYGEETVKDIFVEVCRFLKYDEETIQKYLDDFQREGRDFIYSKGDFTYHLSDNSFYQDINENYPNYYKDIVERIDRAKEE